MMKYVAVLLYGILLHSFNCYAGDIEKVLIVSKHLEYDST